MRSRGPGKVKDAILLDNLETRQESILAAKNLNEEYFHPEDFEVGKSLQISGRNMLIYDCDSATRQYYAEVYNKCKLKYTEHLKYFITQPLLRRF